MSGIFNDIHIIRAEKLIELMNRAHAGEDPEMLYIETWANGTHWELGKNAEDEEDD